MNFLYPSCILPLGLLAWALLLATLPRTRTAWLLTAFAIAVEVALYAPRIHMHDTYAYYLFAQANGAMGPDWSYGEGRVALLSWPLWLMGHPVDGTHWVNAALTTLAVPHLYAVVRKVFDERTGVVAGVLFALAPLPLALATTETAYVPMATMEILAVHGLIRGGLIGDAMLIVGAGMVTHLRPLEGLIGAALAMVAWAMGRRIAAVGAAALVGWRLWIFWNHPWPPGKYTLTTFLPSWHASLLGSNAGALVLDPLRTPVALTVLAVVGLVIGAKRAPRATAGIAALGAFSTVAHMSFPYLADRMRYELPSQLWLCALAAVALVQVSRHRVLSVVTGLAMAGSWGVARQPYPPFPWQTEYTTLRQALRTLPPHTRVAYDDSMDGQGLMRDWALAFSGVELVPLSSATPDDRWRWVGLVDHAHGVKPPLPSPAVVTTIAPLTWPTDPYNNNMWHCSPCEDKPLTIGLYRRDAPP